jgi:predicted membrane-bound spermidine synthase
VRSARMKNNFSVFGLFCLCFSSLALQVALTRVYSVIFIHSYVYLIISVSMAGLGLGAVLLHYLRDRARRVYLQGLVVMPALTFALLVLVNNIYSNVFCSLLLTLALFTFIGSCTTLLFLEARVRIPVLYAADLAGASLGALSCYFLLNSFGAVKAIILLLVLLCLSIALLSALVLGNPKNILLPVTAVLVTAAFTLPLDLSDLVSPARNRLKDMATRLADPTDNPRVIDSRWSAFGRSDLVETDNPLLMTMYVDGGAGTKMLKLDRDKIDPELAKALRYQYIGGIPLLGVPADRKQDALVVGSGGGIDVVTLLASAYRNITAVEINPDFVQMVRDYSDYNGGLYRDYPGVTVVNEDGRTYLRRHAENYDVLLMSLPIIKSARNYGSYALSENYLFTVDAFSEYLSALKRDGILVVVAHYNNEAYRLLVNALKAFQLRGDSEQEALRSIVLIGRDSAPALIVKNGRITPEEAEFFYGAILSLEQQGEANYVPLIPQHQSQYREPESGAMVLRPFQNEKIYAMAEGLLGLTDFVAQNRENISWVSDDSPFFYQMAKGLPKDILYAFSVVTGILLLVMLLFAKNRPIGRRDGGRYFAGFGLLGCAFMLVEASILQKFILFWGQQTLALSWVLSLVLLSTGLGSWVSGTFGNHRLVLRSVLILAPILILLDGIMADILLTPFESASLPVKAMMSACYIFPVFFVLGFPFPTLLRMVRDAGGDRLFPWLIGVNSLGTLLGGVMAILLALLWGYSALGALGAGLYLSLLSVLAGCGRTVSLPAVDGQGLPILEPAANAEIS